ncbi:hypothetical protein [Actinoallomurus vinaceus]|uniref:hypothetical protein n=1 Tax=Actinoallomurus vinaceus TaxID=1080074 RepID=UPI0031E6BC00
MRRPGHESEHGGAEDEKQAWGEHGPGQAGQPPLRLGVLMLGRTALRHPDPPDQPRGQLRRGDDEVGGPGDEDRAAR